MKTLCLDQQTVRPEADFTSVHKPIVLAVDKLCLNINMNGQMQNHCSVITVICNQNYLRMLSVGFQKEPAVKIMLDVQLARLLVVYVISVLSNYDVQGKYTRIFISVLVKQHQCTSI